MASTAASIPSITAWRMPPTPADGARVGTGVVPVGVAGPGEAVGVAVGVGRSVSIGKGVLTGVLNPLGGSVTVSVGVGTAVAVGFNGGVAVGVRPGVEVGDGTGSRTRKRLVVASRPVALSSTSILYSPSAPGPKFTLAVFPWSDPAMDATAVPEESTSVVVRVRLDAFAAIVAVTSSLVENSAFVGATASSMSDSASPTSSGRRKFGFVRPSKKTR